MVVRKAKNLPQVYLEQGERSERLALRPADLAGRLCRACGRQASDPALRPWG